MKSYKKSSFHKLYLIDVEKQEIIDLNEEHMDGVVEKFNSKPFLWSNAHDCIPCGGFRCGSFPCSGCKKVFTTKFSLKRHFKTFHTPANTEPPQTSAEKSVDHKRKVSDMTPNVENETLKKPKWTRGQKRKKSMPQSTVFKQMHLEPSSSVEDFNAPRGIKRKIKRTIDTQPNKKSRWVNF